MNQTRYHVLKAEEGGAEQFVSCWESSDGANSERIHLSASEKDKQKYRVQPVGTCDGNHSKAPA